MIAGVTADESETLARRVHARPRRVVVLLTVVAPTIRGARKRCREIEDDVMRMLPTLLLACTIAGPMTVAAQERETAGTNPSDSTLAVRVRTALIENEATKASQIQVETQDGVVQLSGFVDSELAQEAALKAARSVPGVREVHNGLDVRAADRTAGQAAKDGVIEGKVKAAIAKDEGLAAASDINVEVNDGVVQLSGFLPSLEQKNRARDVAARVGGVRDVRNNIALEGAE
jgi:hyperosmotically inducible protein